MEQALNDWQRKMPEALGNVDAPGADRVRESLPSQPKDHRSPLALASDTDEPAVGGGSI